MGTAAGAGSPDALPRPVEIIAYLISPIHLVAALGAAKALHGDAPIRISVVVHWPYADARQVEELLTIIRQMGSKIADIASFRPITTASLSTPLGRPDTLAAAAELRTLLGGEDYDEIYYAHDVVGEFYWALAETYPRARRVCYGDGLGIVYERKYHMDISYPPIEAEAPPQPTEVPSILERFRARLRNWSAGKPPVGLPEPAAEPVPQPAETFGSRAAPPHLAALILPVDQSGRFLRNVELRVVPRSVVTGLVDLAAAGCGEFLAHTESILQRCGDRPKFLLITENNAEGECISLEREVEMYCSVVRKYCSKGSAIILKSHPGETLPRNEAIMAQLAGDFELIELDPRFKRYPIELAKRLLHQCTPICMSYPTLSLKYLYQIDVIQPMNDGFIEAWFPKRFWSAYKNSFPLYDEPLKRLGDWDGKSLLWSGG